MKNKDITPHNKKGQKHGYWEVYNPDDSLFYKCTYVNDLEVGYDEVKGLAMDGNGVEYRYIHKTFFIV